MTDLTLYFHPLSSFCWKVLVPLYENDTPFEPVVVDLADAQSRARFEQLWPLAKFPVLRDRARAATVPESTIIIDYLDAHHPGKTRFVPTDVELARRVRLGDRFYDSYVHLPMQKIVGDRIRPKGDKDPFGVGEAKRMLSRAYDMLEADLADRTWATGEAFTLADCAAFPALHYADKAHPFRTTHAVLSAYLTRLEARPSVRRVLAEAEPYFKMFPAE